MTRDNSIYRDSRGYGGKDTNNAFSYMITASTCRGAFRGLNYTSGGIIKDRGLWINTLFMIITAGGSRLLWASNRDVSNNRYTIWGISNL